MKLTKLSLAAILAAGALSSVSAAPLEEAIKDIDVSGFGRYRFDSTATKDDEGAKTHGSAHRFTLDVNFKATLDDNFFSVIGVRYDGRDVVGSHTAANSGTTNTPLTSAGFNGKEGLTVRQYYVGYTGIPDTTVLFGRQPAGTFFTDDVVATGLKVANTSIPGLTLAGVFYTNFEKDGDMAALPFADGSAVSFPAVENGAVVAKSSPVTVDQKNLWGVAAIGSYDWFGFQAWYAGLNEVAHLYAGELTANVNVADDAAIRGKVQVAGTTVADTFARLTNDRAKGSTFVGVDAGFSGFGLDADVGFMSYGKKAGVTVHTLEDQGGLISAGEDLLDYTFITGKHTDFFAKFKYTFDAYSFGFDYVYDHAKAEVVGGEDDKFKGHEFVVRLGYKYNSKLNFNVWNSYIKTKTGNNVDGYAKERANHFRFEARYNF